MRCFDRKKGPRHVTQSTTATVPPGLSERFFTTPLPLQSTPNKVDNTPLEGVGISILDQTCQKCVLSTCLHQGCPIPSPKTAKTQGFPYPLTPPAESGDNRLVQGGCLRVRGAAVKLGSLQKLFDPLLRFTSRFSASKKEVSGSYFSDSLLPHSKKSFSLPLFAASLIRLS